MVSGPRFPSACFCLPILRLAFLRSHYLGSAATRLSPTNIASTPISAKRRTSSGVLMPLSLTITRSRGISGRRRAVVCRSIAKVRRSRLLTESRAHRRPGRAPLPPRRAPRPAPPCRSVRVSPTGNPFKSLSPSTPRSTAARVCTATCALDHLIRIEDEVFSQHRDHGSWLPGRCTLTALLPGSRCFGSWLGLTGCLPSGNRLLDGRQVFELTLEEATVGEHRDGRCAAVGIGAGQSCRVEILAQQAAALGLLV